MTPTPSAEERRSALALAALVFGLAAPSTYVLERLYEYARGDSVNPVLILRTLDTVYYWRVGVAVWWGASVAGLAYALLLRRPGSAAARAARLSLAALVLVPVIAVVAWVFP